MSLEGFFFDASLNRVRLAHAKSEVQANRALRQLSSDRDVWADAWALRYGQLGIALNYLRQQDPGNPMFDEEFERRMNEAIDKVWRSTKTVEEYETAVDRLKVHPRAGGEPPSIPDLQASNASLRAEVAALKQQIRGLELDLVDHMVQRLAFRSELMRSDSQNPLLTNAGLRAQLQRAGRTAHALSDGDWTSVKKVGEEYMGEARKRGGVSGA